MLRYSEIYGVFIHFYGDLSPVARGLFVLRLRDGVTRPRGRGHISPSPGVDDPSVEPHRIEQNSNFVQFVLSFCDNFISLHGLRSLHTRHTVYYSFGFAYYSLWRRVLSACRVHCTPCVYILPPVIGPACYDTPGL